MKNDPQLESGDFQLEELEPRLLLDATWVDLDGGDWADGANWSGGSAPVAGENVIIPSLNAGASITVGASVSVGSISVSGGSVEIENGATMTVNSGGSLTGDATIEVTDGELEQTGGDLAVEDDAQVVVASAGTWTVGRLATVTLDNRAAIANAGTITVAGQFQDGADAASTSYLQTSGGLYLTGPPVETTDLVDLFDPAQGVTTSGGSVSAWTNLSGGADLSVSDPETSLVDGPNGTSMIRFNNNSSNAGASGLGLAVTDEASLRSNGYVIFAVVRLNGAIDDMGASDAHIIRTTDGNQAPLTLRQSDDNLELQAAPIGSGDRASSSYDAAIGETVVLMAEVLPDSQRLYVNGELVSEELISVGGDFTMPDGSVWEIGEGFVGDIGHIAIYDGSVSKGDLNNTGQALANIYGVGWTRLEQDVAPQLPIWADGSIFRLAGSMTFDGGVIDGTGQIGADVVTMGKNVTVTTSQFTGHNGLGYLAFDVGSSLYSNSIWEMKTSGDADRTSRFTFSGTGLYDLREATGKMVTVDSPLSVGTAKWVANADSINLLKDGILFGSVEPIWGDGTTDNPLIKVNFYNSGRTLRTKVAVQEPDTYVFTGAVDDAFRTAGNWTVDGVVAANSPTPGTNIVIPEGTTIVAARVSWAFNSIVLNGTLDTTSGSQFTIRDADASSIGANGVYTSSIGPSLRFSTGSSLAIDGSVKVGSGTTSTLITDAAVVLGSGASINVGPGDLELAGGISGTGTVTASKTIIYTHIKPAGDETVGTLSFVGDVTLTAGMTTTLDIIDDSTFDVVAVSGNIDYAGTLLLNVIGGPVLENSMIIVTAATSIDLGSSVQVVGGTLTGLFPFGGGLIIDISTESSLSSTIRSSLSGLESVARQFGSFFDLDEITGATAPESPVLPSTLDDLFDIAVQMPALSLPSITQSATNDGLASLLMGAGYTVDFISGGATVGGTTIPDAPGGSSSLIQIRYDATVLADQNNSGSYIGDSFNDATPELLQGLSSSTSLTGSIAWTASLGAALIFGVDGDGFFVSADSALVLAAAGTGTVSGTGTVGGVSNISIDGTAEADLTVRLALKTASETYTLAELDGLLANQIAPTISGTAAVAATMSVGGLSLSYAGGYTATETFATRTSVVELSSATLSGTYTLPGLTLDDSSTAAAVAVTGSYDGGSDSWTLSGTFDDLDFDGLNVSSGSVAVTLDDGAFAGTLGMTLEPDFIDAGASAAAVVLSSSFNASSGTITGSATLADVVIKTDSGETLLSSTSAQLSVSLTVDYDASSFAGSIALTTTEASLLPDSEYTAELSDGDDADAFAAELDYDFDGNEMAFAFDGLEVVVPNVIRFAAAGFSASYTRQGDASTRTLAVLDDVVIDVVALENASGSDPPNPQLTTSELTIRSDGFSIATVSSGLGNVEVGDFLTLDNTTVSLTDLDYTQGSAPTGSIDISATGGRLYGDSPALDVQIQTVSGALDPETKILSLAAGGFTAQAGEAFGVQASNINLAYDADGAASQEIASIGSASITATVVDGFDPATVDSLVLRANGMAFGSFTIAQGVDDTITVGDAAVFDGAAFVVTNFDAQYAAGSVSFTGTVAVTADTISLFPSAASYVETTLNGASASFSFSGADPTGDFEISASSLSATFGEAVTVTTGSFTFAPGSSDPSTVSSATVSSELVTGLDDETISGVAVSSTGIAVGSVTLTPGDGETVGIGDFITFAGSSLVLTDLELDISADDPVTGSIALAATGASLYPDSDTVAGSLSGLTAAYDLSGANPSLELAIAATALSLDVGDALRISASNISIDPGEATFATLATATASSPNFAELGTAAIENLALTQSGFSIDTLTLGAEGGVTISFGEHLDVLGTQLIVSDFVFDVATGIDGSIGLGASGVSIYPGQDAVTATVDGITAAYDFENGGGLEIGLDTLTIAVGDALNIAASDVTLTPEEETFLSIADAQASSPTFGDLGSTQMELFELTQSGFTIGALTLGPEGGATVNYDSVMLLEGVQLDVSDFVFDLDDGTSGDFGLSITGLQLYPDSDAFTASVVDPVASFDFEGDGSLLISASAFSLQVGEALLFSAADVVFTPSDDTILSLSSAVATSPSVAGAGQAVLSDATFTRDGFEFGSFELGLPEGQTLDYGALELTGARVFAENFSYNYDSDAIGGTVGISASGLNLYPGADAVTAEASDIATTYSFSEDAWQISIGTFALQVAEALRVEATNVLLTPNEDTLMTIGTATALSPSLTGMGTAALTDVAIRKDGFSLGSFSFGMADSETTRMGNYLELSGAQLVVTDFEYAYANGEGSVSAGGIGLTAVGLQLFPDATSLETEVTGLAMLYDFAGDGELIITAATFSMSIGTALQLDAVDITITPDRDTILTVAALDASSPALAGMTAILEGLVVTRGGFAIASLDLIPQPGATITLGSVGTLTGASIGVRNFVYTSADNEVTGSIALGALELTLFPGNDSFTAVATDIVGTFPIDGSGVGSLSLEVGTLDVRLGGLLRFSAKDLLITPEGATIVTVGVVGVELTMGETTIEASGGNFSILSDGSFRADAGFFVSLNLSTGPAALAMPAWLGFSITELTLIWPDFNAAPETFFIQVSAGVTGIAGQSLAVSGAVSDMLIDPNLVAKGENGIIDVGAVSVTVGGEMFGGEATGSLALGVVRLDAAGEQISTGDFATPVASSTFYGGIRATFSMGGLTGFSLSVGLSELGPINVYVSSGTPIIIDPASGLAMTNIRGGVLFNTTIPETTDPFELRGAAFQPQGELTDAQWLELLEASVVEAARAPPEGDFWEAFSQPMRMELGATLYSISASTNAFRADVDLIFDTNGKMVVAGDFIFGNSAEIGGWLYMDLKTLEQGALEMLFLADQPKDLPVFTVFGRLTLEFSRTDGQEISSEALADSVTFSMTEGGMIVSAVGLVEVKFTGNVEMSYADSALDLVFDGVVELPFMGEAIGAAGELHVVDPSGDDPKIWGAIVLDPDFAVLENLGLTVDGFAMLRINSTLEDKSVELAVPGREDPVIFELPSLSTAVYVYDAVAQFRQGGQSWFRMTGELSFEITPLRLEAFVVGDLLIGPEGAETLKFSAVGFMQITLAGMAAKLELTRQNVWPGAGMGIEIGSDVSFLMVLNTTGADVSYTMPDSVSGSDVAMIDGSRTISIDAKAPGAAEAGSYLIVRARGDLSLLGAMTLEGDHYILITPEALQLYTDSKLALRAGSATILSFNVKGGIHLGDTAAAAALEITLSGRQPSAFGFTLSGDYFLEFNATGEAIAIGAFALEAGTFVRARLDGKLTAYGMAIVGTFIFSADETQVTIAAKGTLDLKAGNSTKFKLEVEGGLQVSQYGIAAALTVALASTPSLDSGITATLGATAKLRINGTNRSVKIGSVTLASGRYAKLIFSGNIRISNAFYLFGTFEVSVSSSSILNIAFSGRLDVRVPGTSRVAFRGNLSGALSLRSTGILAAFKLSMTNTVSSTLGYKLSSARSGELRLNTTTGRTYVVLNGRRVWMNRGTVELTLRANILAGPLTLRSKLTVKASGSSLSVALSGTVVIMGKRMKLGSGWLRIYSDGMAGSFGLTLSRGTLGAGLFKIRGRFQLQVNTRSRTSSGIPSRTFRVSVSRASITVFYGFKLTGSFFIEARGNSSRPYFRITIPKSSPLTLNVSGIAKVQVYGYLTSSGKFRLRGKTSISVGNSSYVRVTGTLSVSLSSRQKLPSIRFKGKLYLLGRYMGSLNGSLGRYGLSLSKSIGIALTGSGRLFSGKVYVTIGSKGVKASGSLSIKFWGKKVSFRFNVQAGPGYKLKWTAQGSFSKRKSWDVGVFDLGYRFSTTVFFSSRWSDSYIRASGDAFAENVFKDVRVGFSMTIYMNGKFNLLVKNWLKNVRVKGDFGGTIRSRGSDIVGGYGFVDTDGSGVWTPERLWIPVDENGELNYELGDPALWTVAAGYGYHDLNANGVWDQDSEKRVPLDEDGTLPDLITDAQASMTIGTPEEELGLLAAYARLDEDGKATSELDTDRGTIMVTGGSTEVEDEEGEVTLTPNGTAIALDQELVGFTGLYGADQIVFFDTNGNGVADASEVRAEVDEEGVYTFEKDAEEPELSDVLTPEEALGSLAAYAALDPDGNPVPRLDTEKGILKVVGGSTAVYDEEGNATLTPNEGALTLGHDPIGFTGLVGEDQVVFFDTNGNGVADDFEVKVNADERGDYAFAVEQEEPEIKDLGLLALYDLNGNGILDPDEGSIVITGGIDRNTGEPTSAVIRVDGAALAAGASVVTPLTPVISAVAKAGATDIDAAALKLGAALGIPDTIDLLYFDPSGSESNGEEGRATQKAMSHVESLLSLGGELMVEASSGLMSEHDAHSALLDSLGTTIAGSDGAIDLSDAAVIEEVIGRALEGQEFEISAGNRQAVAAVIAALNGAATGYAASSANVIRDMARIEAVGSQEISDAIAGLLSGATTADAFVSMYTGEPLDTLLADAPLVELTPPTLAPIVLPEADETEAEELSEEDDEDEGTTTVGLDIEAGLVPMERLQVSATAANGELLPEGSVTPFYNGDVWSVRLNPAADVLGSSEVTVLVSDGSTVTEQRFNFTVVEAVAPAPAGPEVVSVAPTNAVAGEAFEYLMEVESLSDDGLPNEDAVVALAPVGELPAWLSFVDNGDGTGLLSGTPPVELIDEEGLGPKLELSFTATEEGGGVSQDDFTLIVSEEDLTALPDFLDTALPDAVDGEAFSHTIAADVPVFEEDPEDLITEEPIDFDDVVEAEEIATLFISGENMPAWMTLTDNGDGTATIGGTPSFADVGEMSFTLVISDEFGQRIEEETTIFVGLNLGITPVDDVTVSEDGSATVDFSLSGTEPFEGSVAVSSDNPGLFGSKGLKLSGSGADRTLTITPAADASGTAQVTVSYTVDDTVVTETFTVNVAAVDDPVVVENALPTLTRPVGAATLSFDLERVFGGADGEVSYALGGNLDPALITSAAIEGGTLTVTLADGRAGLGSLEVIATSVGGASGELHQATSTLRFNVVPTASVSGPMFTRSGGRAYANFTVKLDAVVNQDVSVAYSTVGGTALAGVDYEAGSGRAIIRAGSDAGTISVRMLGYNFQEDLTFGIELGKADGARMDRDNERDVEIPVDHILLHNLNGGGATVKVGLRISYVGFAAGLGDETADEGVSEEEDVFLLPMEAVTSGALKIESIRVGDSGAEASWMPTGLQAGSPLVFATSLESLARPGR